MVSICFMIICIRLTLTWNYTQTHHQLKVMEDSFKVNGFLRHGLTIYLLQRTNIYLWHSQIFTRSSQLLCCGVLNGNVKRFSVGVIMRQRGNCSERAFKINRNNETCASINGHVVKHGVMSGVFLEWSLESVLEWSLESFLESYLESFLESILNSILPIYNNTKQTQKRSNELKIVGGRLSSVLTQMIHLWF